MQYTKYFSTGNKFLTDCARARQGVDLQRFMQFSGHLRLYLHPSCIAKTRNIYCDVFFIFARTNKIIRIK